MALKALEVARVFVPSLEEEAERSEVERAMQGLWVLARISHTSRLAVVGRATWLAVASGGAIMRRNIGPS